MAYEANIIMNRSIKESVFLDIISELPTEVKAIISKKISLLLDIEGLIRHGKENDIEEFAKCPVIPYMEIQYPYVRFEKSLLHGGISLREKGFNDLQVHDDRLSSLKEIMDMIFNENTELHRLVICLKSFVDVSFINKHCFKYINKAQIIHIVDPHIGVTSLHCWTKVSKIIFRKKRYLPCSNHHKNLKEINYTDVTFSGITSMSNFIVKAITETSTYLTNSKTQKIILKFRIMEINHISKFKSDLNKINDALTKIKKENLDCIFYIPRTADEYINIVLRDGRIIRE